MNALIIIVLVVLALSRSVRINVSCTEDEEKDLVPPCGLGGYVEPDLENAFPLGESHIAPGDKLKEPAMSYRAQQGRKTLILIKDLEAELEERSDPACKAIPWGYTNPDKTGKSDDRYEEPQATYPVEMEQ